MGTGVFSKEAELTNQYSYKSVMYNSERNNIVVVYGRERTQADCIICDISQKRGVYLMHGHSSVSIINRKASILCEGTMKLEGLESLLHMQCGSCIRIGAGAYLEMYGMLLMEKNTCLEVSPGVELHILGSLHIKCGGALTVSRDMCVRLGDHLTVAGNMDWLSKEAFDESLKSASFPQKISLLLGRFVLQSPWKDSVTWCEDDKDFLVKVIWLLCWKMKIQDAVILPYVLPELCQRYGVLMAPRPYKVPGFLSAQVKCPFLMDRNEK